MDYLIDSFVFNASAFLAGLCFLGYGADAFIDNAAIVARRLGLSETLVALLTVGAEWEELAVVVAAIIQRKPSIALGNVIGSSISDILGAFSLGLLFYPGPVVFNRSAKIYTSILFVITTIFTIIALTNEFGRVAGIFFIALFAVYELSIIYGIYKGVLDVVEDEESEGDESEGAGFDDAEVTVSETTALLPDGRKGLDNQKPKHPITWHVFLLVLGFIALSLSGYVLSHTTSTLASILNLSETVLGITVLSFATTVPEKFLTVLSGIRGHSGIVIAATAGSNIFLLTLCLGTIFILESGDQMLIKGLERFEIWTAWAGSVVLVAIVFVGGRRWMGAVLLIAYFTFIVLEFTVYRR